MVIPIDTGTSCDWRVFSQDWCCSYESGYVQISLVFEWLGKKRCDDNLMELNFRGILSLAATQIFLIMMFSASSRDPRQFGPMIYLQKPPRIPFLRSPISSTIVHNIGRP